MPALAAAACAAAALTGAVGCTLPLNGLGDDDAGSAASSQSSTSTASASSTTIHESSHVDPPDAQSPEAAVADACATNPAQCVVVPHGPCPSDATDIELTAVPSNSGAFGTTGAVCVKYRGSVNGWGLSNGMGRMVTVTGSATQGPLDGSVGGTLPAMGAGADGYVYWSITAGQYDYAALYTF